MSPTCSLARGISVLWSARSENRLLQTSAFCLALPYWPPGISLAGWPLMFAAQKQECGSPLIPLVFSKTQNLCFTSYTKCMSMLLIGIWILAFCLYNPLFCLLYSVELILPLTLVLARAAACLSLRDIDCQETAWKLCCPFSPFSLFLRQGTYWETNVRARKIVLHIESVIKHCSPKTWQGFAIHKVGSKHLMMKILAAVHSA